MSGVDLALGPARTIVALAPDPDEPGAWIAKLDCHHRRHLRHRPPLSSMPWLLDPDQRAARIGAPLECGRCAMREWPEGLERYRETRLFTDESVPAGLRAEHSTKRGVWGRLELDSGRLALCFAAPHAARVELEPGQWAAIPPQLRHQLELDGPARFRVAFYR